MINFKSNLILLLTLLSFTCIAQEEKENKPIEFGHEVNIHSEILNEERELMIYVPQGAEEERFPVLYLLDARGHYYSVSGLVKQLSTTNGNTVLPKMIIVGIKNTNRTRDLTPTKGDPNHIFVDEQMAEISGGGAKFMDFIEQEVFPYIENNYPTQNYRTFIGHSFGGLAVMNAWLNYNHLFNAYVAIDPSMWWSNRQLANEIKATPITEKFAGKSLYIGIANTMDANMDVKNVMKDTSQVTDHIRAIFDLHHYLSDNSAPHLKYQGKYYPEDTHGSVPLIAEYDALRFIFDFHDMKMGPKDFMDPEVDLAGKLAAHYQSLTKNFGYELLPEESFINMMGYQMIQLKQLEKAEALFKLNIVNYPKSYNVYDSLADCYIEMGEEEKAKTNFKKSIELNEKSPSVRKLKKLENGGEEEFIEVEVEASILDSYIGKYELMPGFSITISKEANSLYGQGTGQPKFEMFASSNTEFFLKDVDAQITFQVKEDKVESMTLYQGGQEVVGKKVD